MFLSIFWQGLFVVHGMDLLLSSPYRPQTDDQTKVVNRCLETYLRCMRSHSPHEWSKWLALVEWLYNTTYHITTHMPPYEMVYNQPTPLHLPYLPGESKVEVVDRSLQKREEMIALLKHHMARAQNRMKQLTDAKRFDTSFKVGDWLWLKYQLYRQSTLATRSNEKLNARYS